MYHIVKRSAELNGRVGGKLSGGDSWFVQTALNKNPVGHLAKKNDIIYAHEIGRGVWAKGKITAIRNVVTINDLKVLIKYSQQTTNYNNAPFWDHIIQEKGSRLNGTNLLHIFEVRADLKKFYKEKALPVQYRSRQSWITLQVKPSFK